VDDLDTWATIGAVAAAVGIVAWLGTVIRWSRARWQRRHTLRALLEGVEHQNEELEKAATEISLAMIEGVEWHGWRIVPPQLKPGVDMLGDADAALEQLHARTRGVRAEPAVERLRADIERAIFILRRRADLYYEGTMATYRLALNEPPGGEIGLHSYQPGAGGDDPAPALHGEDAAEEARQLDRELDLMVRSAWHQIGDDERAAGFKAGWLVRSYQLPRWNSQLEPPAAGVPPSAT
jgi:hypothetical protein